MITSSMILSGPDECPCLVCILVQKDPHQLTCCGKIFCKSCLDQLIKHNKSCPNCRGNFIRGEKYFFDVNTERKINHLRIHCGNEQQGCTWIGCMKDLEGSHVVTCPFEPVHCTNKRTKKYGSKMVRECGILVHRSNLQKHMTTECEWRQVMCVRCKIESSFTFINGQHIELCPSTPIACYNKGCHEKVKRSLMEQHQAICPHVIVTCQYSSVCCEKEIKRGDIQTHNKECMEEHLDNAVGKLEKALKRIQELEAKVRDYDRDKYGECYYSDDYDNDYSEDEFDVNGNYMYYDYRDY